MIIILAPLEELKETHLVGQGWGCMEVGRGRHGIWFANDLPIVLLITDIQSGRIFLSHSTFWTTAYGVGVRSSMNRHCPRTNIWGSGRRERRNRGETAMSAAWKRGRCRLIRVYRGKRSQGSELKGSEDEGGGQMEERAAKQEGRGSKSCMRPGHGEKEVRQKEERGSEEQK